MRQYASERCVGKPVARGRTRRSTKRCNRAYLLVIYTTLWVGRLQGGRSPVTRARAPKRSGTVSRDAGSSLPWAAPAAGWPAPVQTAKRTVSSLWIDAWSR